jgi:hypothetical protein
MASRLVPRVATLDIMQPVRGARQVLDVLAPVHRTNYADMTLHLEASAQVRANAVPLINGS